MMATTTIRKPLLSDLETATADCLRAAMGTLILCAEAVVVCSDRELPKEPWRFRAETGAVLIGVTRDEVGNAEVDWYQVDEPGEWEWNGKEYVEVTNA